MPNTQSVETSGVAVDPRLAGERTSPPAVAADRLACPDQKFLRDRLRAIIADQVASWRSGGLPSEVRSAAGLRARAATIVARGGGAPSHVGWAMVTIVSEYWRDRLVAGPGGRRLLLLPDCPSTVSGSTDDVPGRPPHTCGPACVVGTLWAAARDCGWVVETTRHAVAGIGGLLTGQYDGILGVAKLEHLEKAFAMLPHFALPIAAVPFDPAAATSGGEEAAGGGGCARAMAKGGLDAEWVLGLLGVGGGGAGQVADYLPLLRMAGELFAEESLRGTVAAAGVGDALVWNPRPAALDAPAAMGADFLGRGGKFLRPFITLAAYEAVKRESAADPAAAVPIPAAARSAAIAIEVFHKASLIHDDIEDADRRRYGRPTLHDEVGVPSAINAGDHLVGLGYRLAATLPGCDDSCRSDVVSMLSEAHLRLARGQGAELWWRDASDKSLSTDEALSIYALKTSPAFEVALAIGVRLAGADPRLVGALDRYARHVGVGFQVLNDLKDWQGDGENDRQAAGDLLGGRPTVMWALARERLTDVDRDRLVALSAAVGRADGPPAAEVVAEARRLYSAADVFARSAAIVDAERAGALAAAATCRMSRLREVMEFLLDLAVPDGAASHLLG